MKAQFTFLGESGSGKTCYLLGMYNELAAGIGGYSITADDELDTKLQDMYDRLFDTSLEKEDRFPAPSDKFDEYEFKVQYAYDDIFCFNWIDYRGGLLKDKDEEEYNKLKQFLKGSNAVYICIDGGNLQGNNQNKKRREIHRNIKDVNRLIADYKRDKAEMPPIVVVITKYDKCCKDTNPGEIIDILKKELNILFVEDTKAFLTVIPVSLGSEIDDSENYNVDPLNIHIPVLVGIYFAMLKEKNKINKQLSSVMQQLQSGKQQEDNLRQIVKDDGFFAWLFDDDVKHKEHLGRTQLANQKLVIEEAKYSRALNEKS